MFSKDRRFKYGTGGVVLALIATAALAADPAPAASPDSTCPPGHRGDIDLGKMNARAAKAFESADANGDGKITQAEFLAAKPPHGRRGRTRWSGTGHARSGHDHGHRAITALTADLRRKSAKHSRPISTKRSIPTTTVSCRRRSSRRPGKPHGP